MNRKDAEILLELKNVSKSYDSKVVLNNINFKIYSNEIVALMAPSGYGKTTMLNVISGTANIDFGEIILNVDKKEIAYMFQENRLIDDLSVMKNLRLVSKNNDKIIDYLKQFKILESKDEKIINLSGGMKRRVALIRALINDKKLILLDEPFNGVDEATKNELIKYLIKYKNQNKCSIILVTHDENDARKLTDIVVNLQELNKK